MFGLASPPCPPNAPRWPAAGLSTLSAMFGIGNNNNNDSSTDNGGVKRGGSGGGLAGAKWEGTGGGDGSENGVPRDLVSGGPSEAEEDALPLDILPGNRQSLAIDRRVDDLLRLLRPAPRAEGYRRSVFRFVTRQVCRSVFCWFVLVCVESKGAGVQEERVLVFGMRRVSRLLVRVVVGLVLACVLRAVDDRACMSVSSFLLFALVLMLV